MESMRKRIKMELSSCPRRLKKLFKKLVYKDCHSYGDYLMAVTLHNKIINFCKPMYIGMETI